MIEKGTLRKKWLEAAEKEPNPSNCNGVSLFLSEPCMKTIQAIAESIIAAKYFQRSR
jgi:hypothetical protein